MAEPDSLRGMEPPGSAGALQQPAGRLRGAACERWARRAPCAADHGLDRVLPDRGPRKPRWPDQGAAPEPADPVAVDRRLTSQGTHARTTRGRASVAVDPGSKGGS